MSTIVPYNTSDNGTVDCIHGNDTYIMNCSSPTSPPDMTTAMPNLPPKLTEGEHLNALNLFNYVRVMSAIDCKLHAENYAWGKPGLCCI